MLSPMAQELRTRFLEGSEEDASGLLKWYLDEAKANETSAKELHSALTVLVDDSGLDKPIRRLLRKGLFLLSQQGVGAAVAIEESAEPLVLTWQAWLSSTDGTGTCRVLLARPDDGLNYRLLDAFLKENEGIVDVVEDRVSVHELPDAIESVQGKYTESILFAECDPDYVKWRVAQSVQETRDRGNRVPNTMAYWAAVLPSPTTTVPHPANSLEYPAPAEDHPIGMALVLPQTRGWMYEMPVLKPMIRSLMEASKSEVEVAEDVRDARLSGIVQQAAAELFEPKVAAAYERRLRDLALLFHSNGKGEEAALALAAAKEIADKGQESEFAKILTQKTYVYFMEAMRQSR